MSSALVYCSANPLISLVSKAKNLATAKNLGLGAVTQDDKTPARRKLIKRVLPVAVASTALGVAAFK